MRAMHSLEQMRLVRNYFVMYGGQQQRSLQIILRSGKQKFVGVRPQQLSSLTAAATTTAAIDSNPSTSH